MSLSSDEVNFLIFRYLQESGFLHTAFTFGHESLLVNNSFNGTEVPSGALISFIQKGLQYKEIETHLGENGDELLCDEPFNVLTPHVCNIKRRIERKEPIQNKRVVEREKEKEKDKEVKEDRKEKEKEREKEEKKVEKEGQKDKKEPEIKNVQILSGHQSEVFICAFNPKSPFLLASGSGDSTARIWNIVNDNPPIEMKNYTNNQDKSKDVTTLDWNSEGTILATGSYDGVARVWTDKGQLKATLVKHRGPIFSLKWNKKGNLLLSGSVDKTAIVWDAQTMEFKQAFEFHSAPTLDVDWRDDVSFATCSTDKMIYVCEVGRPRPIRGFHGHTDEVNAIKWDPTGTLLASCSDDFSAKVWSMKNNKPICNFNTHTKEIYTIRWSNTGPGTNNPNRPLVLASASFDHTVKLWDVAGSKELCTLSKHTDPVYSVAFSPTGEYIASASFDRNIHIWSVKDGSLIRSHRCLGGIFEVCWNSTGDYVAACSTNNTVTVLEFDSRM